jgi:predicted Zn finger-like uncharacterized protein
MQVTCSNCGARYAVDPAALGPVGRTVQCARCGHRWFETTPAPSAAPLPPPPLPPPPPSDERPVPDFVIRPQPPYIGGLPALATPRTTIHWNRWIAVAVGVIVVAGAAFIYRDEITSRLPDEWRAILSFVSPAKAVLATAPRPRLEIDLAKSKVELVDGRYVVHGELLNAGGVAGSTSTLKLVFRKGEDVLGERVYSLVEGPIAPGARLTFSRSLDDPPDGTTNIVPSVE